MNLISSPIVKRFVLPSNPFYLISVALVFWGLESLSVHSFFQQGDGFSKWWLFLVLTFYTSLIGATAILIVRRAQAWSDARTLSMLFVMLLVAMTCYQDRLNFDSPLISWLNSTGTFVLITLMSEGLLKGLQLHLQRGYRLVWHILLAVLTFYPRALSWLLENHLSDLRYVTWGLLFFPLLFSSLSLLLLPLIRRHQPSAMRPPWSWPTFPLLGFAALFVAAMARHYYLCLSFYPGNPSRTPFNIYMLYPFFIALSLITFEIALKLKHRTLSQLALSVPLICFFTMFDYIFSSTLSGQFLSMWSLDYLAPGFMALMVNLAVYLYGWLRQQAVAGFLLLLHLGLFLFWRVDSFTLVDLQWPQLHHWLPLTVGLMVAYKRQSTLVRYFLLGCVGIALSHYALRDMGLSDARLHFVLIHLFWIVCLSAILKHKTMLAHGLKIILIPNSLAVFFYYQFSDMFIHHPLLLTFYVVLIPALHMLLYTLHKQPWLKVSFLSQSFIALGYWLFKLIGWFWQQNLPDGLMAVMGGFVFLGIGCVCSLVRKQNLTSLEKSQT